MNKNNKNQFQSLAGKILIANPYCSFGDIFDKSLIYVASHSETGSLGLILNKCINKVGLKKLYQIPDELFEEKFENIYIGGPAETERSFIIHSDDYTKNTLFEKRGKFAITSNIEIIRDILNGNGPQKSIITLGYTGWGPSELELEIENNYWFIKDADESLIFSKKATKWKDALKDAGIDNSYLSSSMGHS